MTTHAERMMVMFAGSDVGHGTHGEPRKAADSSKWEIKSTAKTLREPVTLAMWELHLKGERPLGIITIRSDAMCKHGSIDYDVYDADLLALIAKVESLKLPLVPCRSKSGGLHLFLFLQDWAPAADVRAVLSDWAAQLGIAGSEVFPKQVQLKAERGDLGNWMVMPYYGGTFDGKLQDQIGLKKTGGTMTIGEFLNAGERGAVRIEDVAKLARKKVDVPRHVRQNLDEDPSQWPEPQVPFGDGPPCLETLARNGVPKGQQNDTLINMGVYYKRRYPDGWHEKLHVAAQSFLTPPGQPEKTADAIRSLEKKDYFYACKKEPMCSHCSSAICRTRPFGVGEANDLPYIIDVRVLKTDPPIWFVDLHNGASLELTTDMLYTYTLFLKACINDGKCVFHAMKQSDWLKIIKPWIESAEPIPVPENSGERGQFLELLEDFCTSKSQGDTLEALFSGRPFLNEDDGHYYFTLGDITDYVIRAGLKDWKRWNVVLRLRTLGAEPFNTRVKGKTLRAWKLKADLLEGAPVLDTPKKAERPI